jgi:ribosome-associated protein
MFDVEDIPEKSKSQIKRELLALQHLGRELVELSARALQKIPLSDPIRQEILSAKTMKMGALQRQIKHIGSMIRDEDVDRIHAALLELRQPQLQAVQAFHEIESWRDALLAGDEKILDQLSMRFTNIDHQHLRQLIRNASKEQRLNKSPKSARALFQYLMNLKNE